MYVDVLCINCEEMIPPEKIEEHSTIWVTIEPYILSLEKESNITHIDFKSQKLSNALNRLMSEYDAAENPSELQILRHIKNQLDIAICACDVSPTSLEICEEASENLSRDWTSEMAL